MRTAVTADKPTPLWRRLLPLVGLASAAFVLSRLDLGALGRSFLSVPAGHILVAALCMALNVVLKGARWQRMLAGRGAHVPMSVAQLVFAEGALWGSLTIGRVGELFRAAPLVERGVPLKPALASCLLDRALDLAFLVVLGGASLALVVDRAWLAYVVVGLGLAGAVVAAATSRTAPLQGDPPSSKVRLVLDEARAFLRPLPLVEAIAWTIASWASSYAVVFVLADAIAKTATSVRVVAAVSIANLSTLLPITYQGVGAREPIFALLLSPDGVSAEAAVALSLTTFAVNLATVLAIGAVAMLVRRARSQRT